MTDIVSTESVLGGAPRIDGRRIGVHHIAKRVIDAGDSPELVAADYDLDLGDVHRALTYYYDHPDEMRAIAARQESVPDDLRVLRGPEDLDEPEEPEPEA